MSEFDAVGVAMWAGVLPWLVSLRYLHPAAGFLMGSMIGALAFWILV